MAQLALEGNEKKPVARVKLWKNYSTDLFYALHEVQTLHAFLLHWFVAFLNIFEHFCTDFHFLRKIKFCSKIEKQIFITSKVGYVYRLESKKGACKVLSKSVQCLPLLIPIKNVFYI